MSDTQRLHHLLDRMLRGVLLPAEREGLAQRVAELEIRARQAEDLQRVAHKTSNRSETERARAAAEVEQLRATLTRVQQLLATGPIGTCCAHLLRAALGHPQPTGTREHLAKGTNA